MMVLRGAWARSMKSRLYGSVHDGAFRVSRIKTGFPGFEWIDHLAKTGSNCSIALVQSSILSPHTIPQAIADRIDVTQYSPASFVWIRTRWLPYITSSERR